MKIIKNVVAFILSWIVLFTITAPALTAVATGGNPVVTVSQHWGQKIAPELPAFMVRIWDAMCNVVPFSGMAICAVLILVNCTYWVWGAWKFLDGSIFKKKARRTTPPRS